MNDYEMIQAVGYGFAMANAHPELKKVAKFETVSNDEYGVIVGIQKLMADGLI
jgi:hydroxymethylpyrimidine pyrophosphatase-like HAD family hydrolase